MEHAISLLSPFVLCSAIVMLAPYLALLVCTLMYCAVYILRLAGSSVRERIEGKRIVSEHDPVNHPKHYTNHPSGVECIQITEHMGFNLGNAIKYIWRADLKNGIEDLRKAAWYIEREIEKREKVKL